MKISAYLLLLLLWLAGPLPLRGQDPMERADRAWLAGDVDTAFQLYSQALRLDPTNVTALHRVALVDAYNQRYDQSLTLLDRALRVAPTYTPAQIDRARVLGWAGRHDEAASAISNTLARERNNVDALAAQAEILSGAGRYQEALAAYDRLQGTATDPSTWALPRARALGALGRFEEGLRVLDPLLASNPSSVEVLELRGQFLYRLGRHAEAQAAYERLLAAAPDEGSYNLQHASVLDALGRPEEAWAAVERGLRETPDDLSGLEVRARIATETGRWAEALESYDRLVARAPEPTPFRIARARILAAMGRHDEAIASLDAISAQGADEVSRLGARAEIAMQAGRFDDAVATYDRLLAIEPDNVAALEGKARSAAFSESYASAVATYDRLMQVSPSPDLYRLERARVLAWNGQYDQALRAVDAVLSEEPTNLEALEAKALYSSWAGRFDESATAYDRLAGSSRDAAVEHALPRARVLAGDEQYQRAIEAYSEILRRDPGNRDALVGLAQVLSFTNQFDSASAVYARVVERDPSDLEARTGQANLANWTGDIARAEGLWRALVEETSPASPDHIVGLASNLRQQGKYGEARSMLRDAASRYPDHSGIRDELGLVETAAAPQVTPSFTYVSDSDENRNTSLGMNATVQLGGPFELRVAGNRRDLQQENRPELDRQTIDGQLVLGARVGPGWLVTGGVGVWQPESDGDDRAVTVAAGIANPIWMTFRAGLDYSRSVFDATALVVQDPVEVDEVQLNMGRRIGSTGAWSANLAGASYHGTEDNTRWGGATQLSFQMTPWLAAGPAVRAFGFQKDLDDGYWDPDSYAAFEVPVTVGPTQGAFRPSLQGAWGYDRKDQAGVEDPWNTHWRVQAGVAYTLGPRRQLDVMGVYASSGVQLSDVAASDYEYRAIRVVFAWAF